VIFNSLIFVVFFSIVLILHAMPFSWRAKKINLLIANYIFYAAWNPPFVILLWVSTVVDWFAARGLAQADDPWKRRAWMLLSVVVSLGLLCYFKYGHFLVENFAHPPRRTSTCRKALTSAAPAPLCSPTRTYAVWLSRLRCCTLDPTPRHRSRPGIAFNPPQPA
jgi:D-alanyl-lipoteichoic acid acyltransferase DltB (MBOAT superfamily)